MFLTWLSTGLSAQAWPVTGNWLDEPSARPRYRAECPLLWRAPGVAQLGEGRLHRILALDLASAQWLLGLDGLRTLAQLMADLAADPSETQARRSLLASAAQVGAVDDASSMPDAWRLLTTRERDLASADHAAALLTLGSSQLADRALNLRHRTTYAIVGSSHGDAAHGLAEVTGQAMDAAGLTRASHGHQADLLVLLGLHPVIGAEVAAIERVQPTGAHLFVAAYGDRAVAGPLVVPGHTSCLRCAYLHTKDADPHWAGVSMQLHASVSRLPHLPIDRMLAHLVAIHAARLARAWVDSPVVLSPWHDVAYEIRLPDGSAEIQDRPAHALCECQWVIEPAVAG